LTGLSVVLGVGLIELCQRFSVFFPLWGPGRRHRHLGHALAAYPARLFVSIVLAIFCGRAVWPVVQRRFYRVFLQRRGNARGAQRAPPQGHGPPPDFMWYWVTALCIYCLSLFHQWPQDHDVFTVWPGAVSTGALCVIISLALLPILESFFSRA